MIGALQTIMYRKYKLLNHIPYARFIMNTTREMNLTMTGKNDSYYCNAKANRYLDFGKFISRKQRVFFLAFKPPSWFRARLATRGGGMALLSFVAQDTFSVHLCPFLVIRTFLLKEDLLTKPDLLSDTSSHALLPYVSNQTKNPKPQVRYEFQI